MTEFANRLFRAAACDHAQLESLLAGFASRTAHLDTEELATAIDGCLAPKAIGHALRCDECSEALDRVGALAGIQPFPAGRLPSFETPAAILIAAIRASAGALEILECTGATRVQAALEVRGARELSAVSLRDRAAGAAFEVGLVPEAESGRLSLIVRWIGASIGLCARAYRAGKLLAETEFEDGSALLANLRTSDLRIEVVRGDETVLAIARLEFEPA